MRWVKLVALLFLLPAVFGLAALTHMCLFASGPERRWKYITRLTQGFNRLLTIILNIKIRVAEDGAFAGRSGRLIVSNHLGYIDGMVLGSLFPVVYVSKKEVRSWPLIGQWSALCGNIFVDRQRKDKIPALVEEMVKKLRQNVNIMLFPEGTSTNGDTLLPFQSAFFAAPLQAQSDVVPVTLRYLYIDDKPVTAENRDRLYWYGDMEFLSHFGGLLALRKIEVLVQIHPEIATRAYQNNSLSRKQLSLECYESVASGLKVGEKREPSEASLTVLG